MLVFFGFGKFSLLLLHLSPFSRLSDTRDSLLAGLSATNAAAQFANGDPIIDDPLKHLLNPFHKLFSATCDQEPWT